jgi:hypothetical protein
MAATADGKLIETAELKAIRENTLLIRLSDILQWPKESVWLNTLLLIFTEVLKAQWSDSADETVAAAKSDWLLEQLDVRQWASRYCSHEGMNEVAARYRNQILSLALMNTEVTTETKGKYWKWFETSLLNDIRRDQPQLYAELIDQVRSIIIKATTEQSAPGTD